MECVYVSCSADNIRTLKDGVKNKIGKTWNFQIEFIGIEKSEDPKKTYPLLVRKEGVAPAQYGIKGLSPERMMEVEEAYDLGAEEMAEGFGSEGESSSEAGGEESFGGSGSDNDF